MVDPLQRARDLRIRRWALTEFLEEVGGDTYGEVGPQISRIQSEIDSLVKPRIVPNRPREAAKPNEVNI